MGQATLSRVCLLLKLAILADCFSFSTRGVDIILGIEWLETLGEVRINWATMDMKFVGNLALTRAKV